MSQWQKFNLDAKEEANVNTSIPGGRFLGLGEHVVTIEAVTGGVSVNEDPFVKLTFTSPTGQTLIDTLFPLYTTKEGDKDFSFKYKSLANALLPEDGVTRFKFFTSKREALLATTPENWPSLVGLSLVVHVERGRRGYTVEDDGGVYRIFDVESKEFVTLAGGAPNEFESYKDARDAATGQGLKRAWNQVVKYSLSPSHVESNREALLGVLEGQPQASL